MTLGSGAGWGEADLVHTDEERAARGELGMLSGRGVGLACLLPARDTAGGKVAGLEEGKSFPRFVAEMMSTFAGEGWGGGISY